MRSKRHGLSVGALGLVVVMHEQADEIFDGSVSHIET
jgi:hypothetical protein